MLIYVINVNLFYCLCNIIFYITHVNLTCQQLFSHLCLYKRKGMKWQKGQKKPKKTDRQKRRRHLQKINREKEKRCEIIRKPEKEKDSERKVQKSSLHGSFCFTIARRREKWIGLNLLRVATLGLFDDVRVENYRSDMVRRMNRRFSRICPPAVLPPPSELSHPYSPSS